MKQPPTLKLDPCITDYDIKVEGKIIDSMVNTEYRDNIPIVRAIIEKNNAHYERVYKRIEDLIIN